MAKTNSKRKTAPRSAKNGVTQRNVAAQQPARKQATRKVTVHSRVLPKRHEVKPRADSKQAKIIAMLRASRGATIEQVADAIGWQHHSVRGFLTGVVRKRLGFNLVSEAGDKGRVYRIADAKAPSVAGSNTSRAA